LPLFVRGDLMSLQLPAHDVCAGDLTAMFVAAVARACPRSLRAQQAHHTGAGGKPGPRPGLLS